MKIFSIQSSTLIVMMMMMMMMMAVSPSIINQLLHKIHHEASNLSKGELPDKFVMFNAGANANCPSFVFCLAEKSLKVENENKTKGLHELLHQYNKETNITCTLDHKSQRRLKIMVQIIKDCAHMKL